MNLSEIRCIRLPELTALLGIGKSSVYLLVANGLLPPPIHISTRCSTWPLGEIRAVVGARAAGKSDDEVRLVVRNIMASRQGCIQPNAAQPG